MIKYILDRVATEAIPLLREWFDDETIVHSRGRHILVGNWQCTTLMPTFKNVYCGILTWS